MSESAIHTRSRQDLAAVVQADIEGRTIDGEERAWTLLLSGYRECDVREVVDTARLQQRQAALDQAALDSRDALVRIATALERIGTTT